MRRVWLGNGDFPFLSIAAAAVVSHRRVKVSSHLEILAVALLAHLPVTAKPLSQSVFPSSTISKTDSSLSQNKRRQIFSIFSIGIKKGLQKMSRSKKKYKQVPPKGCCLARKTDKFLFQKIPTHI